MSSSMPIPQSSTITTSLGVGSSFKVLFVSDAIRLIFRTYLSRKSAGNCSGDVGVSRPSARASWYIRHRIASRAFWTSSRTKVSGLSYTSLTNRSIIASLSSSNFQSRTRYRAVSAREMSIVLCSGPNEACGGLQVLCRRACANRVRAFWISSTIHVH